MNERIEELYHQANVRWTNDYALSGKPREEWRSVPDLFAEFIVRECAGIVNSLEQHEGRGDCSTAEYIREHFGVE